ncbi:hypothetical protein L226DRAFT_323283 [Lentinus tigrinus ALCF2SS1-7]|uniref:Uncharacterized protein n=1 Tax=Lentinus tigrinus ALCF2SS1-6 TaxID=1328759 RepID=A0A5C2SGA4_9APHY|nr:hypothetical protein L227DRAFT_435907 [Lentinus tigrinus ALCF2SS1-6]RPD77468.1 hypothetical protein L226DRAFT_323283 [Lentinus tigrinus ALCF2SS1-7]
MHVRQSLHALTDMRTCLMSILHRTWIRRISHHGYACRLRFRLHFAVPRPLASSVISILPSVASPSYLSQCTLRYGAVTSGVLPGTLRRRIVCLMVPGLGDCLRRPLTTQSRPQASYNHIRPQSTRALLLGSYNAADGVAGRRRWKNSSSH